MFKRFISIALAAMMIFAMAAVAVSAAEVNDANVGADSNNSAGADTASSAAGAGNVIKFDTTGWKAGTFTMVYCHLWERGKDAFYNWQAKAEACKKESDTVYYYDLDKAKITLDPAKDYCVIFSNNIGAQTYDATIGKECIGDTLKMTSNDIENPVDSEKKSKEAVWTTNSSKYGPHQAFTSIGNIVGSKLCPHEKGTEVIGDWLPTYYSSQFLDPVDALAKALPKFGITSADDLDVIYGYIINKNSSLSDGEKKDIYNVLAEGFKKAFPAKASEVKSADEATKSAEQTAKKIKANGGHVTSGGSSSSGGSSDSGSGSSAGSSSGSGSSASSGAGSSSGSGSYNSSGSGSDGQEDTILFILAGVMLVAAGAMYMSRKKREE